MLNGWLKAIWKSTLRGRMDNSTSVSPPTTTPIASLPGELISLIFTHAIALNPSRPSDFFGTLAPSQRRRPYRSDLCRYALVCQSWAAEAQRLLHAERSLTRQKLALAYLDRLETGGEQWHTADLEVFGGQRRVKDYGWDDGKDLVATGTAIRILESVGEGVEKLMLHDFRRSDMVYAEVLCGSNLRDLTTLELIDVFFHQDKRDQVPLRAPFRLDSLHLSDYKCSPAAKNPFSFFGSPRLRRLYITSVRLREDWFMIQPNHHADLALLLNLARSTLTSCYFQHFELPESMVPTFATLTSLTDLGLACNFPPTIDKILNILPNPLSSLTFYHSRAVDRRDLPNTLISIFNTNPRSVQQLTEVGLNFYFSGKDRNDEPAWEECFRQLTLRGVQPKWRPGQFP